ncbi:MAG TPA: diaminopimelate epimerase [Candidatus Stackebrandtia faecavium]|nr:diaminopimelate epimerase [Candidatus Stackebrandtia faecavium]
MIRFSKGHGTGNDFVIVSDPDNAEPLTSAQIAALCDRRRGIGGDGLLRIVRASRHPDAAGMAADAEWFMDYYNADGSIAEMCGNGVRVYAQALREAGLEKADSVAIATRAGVKTVTRVDGEYQVDMGPVRLDGDATAVLAAGRAYSGKRAYMPNPHLVCRVDDIDTLDLTEAPRVDHERFPDGVNVEFIEPTPEGIRMRVHERGVGETLSCGTGACAAAAVVVGNQGECVVEVPGGRLTVTVTPDTILLRGQAVIVAEGTTVLV